MYFVSFFMRENDVTLSNVLASPSLSKYRHVSPCGDLSEQKQFCSVLVICHAINY